MVANLSEQTQNLEKDLWSAVRAMEEKVAFSRQMAEQMSHYNLTGAAKKYESYAANLDQEVSLIRDTVLNGFATKRTIVTMEEEEQPK